MVDQTQTSVTAGAARDCDGTKVQFYTLNVNGRAVDKRFKEFDTIYRLLRSAYAEAPVRSRGRPRSHMEHIHDIRAYILSTLCVAGAGAAGEDAQIACENMD